MGQWCRLRPDVRPAVLLRSRTPGTSSDNAEDERSTSRHDGLDEGGVVSSDTRLRASTICPLGPRKQASFYIKWELRVSPHGEMPPPEAGARPRSQATSACARSPRSSRRWCRTVRPSTPPSRSPSAHRQLAVRCVDDEGGDVVEPRGEQHAGHRLRERAHIGSEGPGRYPHFRPPSTLLGAVTRRSPAEAGLRTFRLNFADRRWPLPA
jgi:hypothetical protein